MLHPLAQLATWFPELDFAVLEHGFAPHGRDYVITVETQFGSKPGRHVITFTHVAEQSLVTQVRDDVWPVSWADVFTDYEAWEAAGEPGGYVWGSNWSLAYPGLEAVESSSRAAEWSRRLGAPMFEGSLTTDRFRLELIFHDIRTEHISDETDLISKIIFPLDG